MVSLLAVASNSVMISVPSDFMHLLQLFDLQYKDLISIQEESLDPVRPYIMVDAFVCGISTMRTMF